ncbi:MAG: hypothetical protein NPINA01_22410 [Nitrospinaceae bacterium]|nr:MAG: hypothetical protein NPINA01_22410 [Nitrospinaceae bacterium]
MKSQDCILFSGGVNGAEAEFGCQAEAAGVEEVNFTFEGHKTQRQRGIRFLTSEELLTGDVSLTYVSKLMNRTYSSGPLFRKVLQSIWHQINHAEEVFVVGKILDDNTVKGGTGWGAEFAKICNKPLHAFDQEKNGWFKWAGDHWNAETEVKITRKHFAGTGTRFLSDNGKKAIQTLFKDSFK